MDSRNKDPIPDWLYGLGCIAMGAWFWVMFLDALTSP